MDWKISLIILVGLLLITGGFLKQTRIDYHNILERGKDFLGRYINEVPEMSVIRNVSVSASFQDPAVDLSNLPIDTIIIKYEPSEQNYGIFISGTKLSTNSLTMIKINKYQGVLKITKDHVDMVGDSEKAGINDITFETSKKSIPIEINSLRYRELEIRDFKVNNLKLNNMNGKLTIQDKMNINLSNEPLTLEAFLGNMEFQNSALKISGRVRRVFVSGKDYSATIS
ncbi:MAG: hypothetical protein J7K87_01845 [Candidatus Aenigmarchaeota archaeon]|nr:hypothetical protein [Candidatus Aenigmarchaeota archaeon]